MPTLKHLNSLQAVEAAVRLGSQKAAGEELGITPAAVGQRIRALEDYLGTQLLERGRAGVTPTPALAAALERLAEGFAALAEAGDLLRYSSHNTVRLAADPDWAALWLRPRLPDFLERNPHCEVLLDTATSGGGDRPDLRLRRSSDVEAGEALYADYLLPVCSPENLARIVDLPEGEKLEGFPLLHLEGESAHALDWPAWVARHGQRQRGADRGVRYRRIEPAVRAMRSNVGMLICGVSLVEAQLESGELLLPFGGGPGARDEASYRLAVRGPALKRPAVREFCAWLREQATETRERLAGWAAAGPPPSGG
jgi:LysR family glycine cleavage system transcriptional activator